MSSIWFQSLLRQDSSSIVCRSNKVLKCTSVSIPSSSGLIFDLIRTNNPRRCGQEFQSLLRQDSSSIAAEAHAFLSTTHKFQSLLRQDSSSITALAGAAVFIAKSFNPFFVRTHLRSLTKTNSKTDNPNVSIPSSSGLIFDRNRNRVGQDGSQKFQSLLRQDSSSIDFWGAPGGRWGKVSIPSSSGLIFDRSSKPPASPTNSRFNPFFVRTHLRS